jgi:hypothetical protein
MYLGGVQEVQNVPHSVWVKTDVAFAVLLAASVFTHALQGALCFELLHS